MAEVLREAGIDYVDLAGNTTYFCSDDFAFPARESVTSSAPCPSCGNSSEVVAVDEEMAGTIAAFVGTHRS